LHKILDALPIPVWLRDSEFTLKYANQAYRVAVEAEDDTPYEDLPEIAPAVGANAGGAALAARARTVGTAQSEERHVVVAGERHRVELVEPPFGDSDDLAGFAIDLTQVEEKEAELSRHVRGTKLFCRIWERPSPSTARIKPCNSSTMPFCSCGRSTKPGCAHHLKWERRWKNYAMGGDCRNMPISRPSKMNS